MRKPSASTKPSLNATVSQISRMRGRTLRPNRSSALSIAAGVAGAGVLQRQVEHAGADLLAALADLLDHPVRAAAEADRQHAADGLRAPLRPAMLRVMSASSSASRSDGAHRERRLLVAPRQRRFGRLVGFAEDHVGAVDDVVRPGLPAVMGAALAVVAGRPRHHLERAVGHAQADVMARGELAGLALVPSA